MQESVFIDYVTPPVLQLLPVIGTTLLACHGGTEESVSNPVTQLSVAAAWHYPGTMLQWQHGSRISDVSALCCNDSVAARIRDDSAARYRTQ